MTERRPICKRCGKFAYEIEEYRVEAEPLRITPAEYVTRYETTFDERTMRFLCTDCFVCSGFPIRTATGGIAYG